MLGKKLTRQQWLALALLTFGIGIVQMQIQEPSLVKVQVYQESTLNASSVITQSFVVEQREQSYLLGLVSIAIACVMSGFAGVYFEKLLKHTQPSIYLRNIQLSMIGIVIGIVMAMIKDGAKVSIVIVYPRWLHGSLFSLL